jgi:hypothetical protein
MSLEDLARRTATVAALAGITALVGAGTWIAVKRPDLARQALRTLARGAEKLRLAVAETAEELGDVWAEARDEVAAEIEARAFSSPEPAPAALKGPESKPRTRRKTRASEGPKKSAPRTSGKRQKASG